MEPIITWVLLADRTVAHIAENRGHGTELKKLYDKTLHAREEPGYSDQQGRGMNGVGTAQHKMEKHIEYTRNEEAFAKQVVNRLEKDRQHDKFHRLIICAGPAMLGLLRRYISNELASCITHEIPKDLTHLPLLELKRHFDGVVNL